MKLHKSLLSKTYIILLLVCFSFYGNANNNALEICINNKNVGSWNANDKESIKQIKVGLPISNHPKDVFRTNEIFIKVSCNFINFRFDANAKNHDTRALSIAKQIQDYQIQKIEKAFPLLEELQSIYKITFNKTKEIDALVNDLQAHEMIEWAEKIPIPQQMYTPNDVQAEQWQFDNISAYDAWDFTQGSSNVVVAVVDDAVLTTHNDLAANIVAGTDVADGDSDPNPPATATNSNFSHGTHVAGIISAVTDNNSGIAALGGNVKIMPIKCKSNTDGGLNLPFAYEGIEYAIDQNVDIINMSWAVYSFSAAMQALVTVAYDRGIFMVAAGGNDGALSAMYPANYVPVMGVGATNENDEIAPVSNWGIAMDVLAPGTDIYSTVAGNNDAFASYTGTSTACALVGGLAALMRSYDSNITPKRIRNCIRDNSDDVSTTDLNHPNLGILPTVRINAAEALSCLNIPPFAYFTVENQTVLEVEICPGQAVQFFDASLGPDISSYQWTFEGGNPATSTEQNPIVTFDTFGNYEATLTVTNPYGTNTETLNVSVFTPTATLSGDTTIISGYGTQLFFDFTGVAPWSVTYTNGTETITIDDIMEEHYVVPIPALESQNWEIVSANDALCNAGVFGGADITVIEVDPCVDCPYYYIQDVLIGGACVNVFNVTYAGLVNGFGENATYPMMGEFHSSEDAIDIGFNHGIIMATGNYTTAFGNNNSGGAGDNLGQNGDADLSQLAGVGITTFDACVVEFDFIPSTDTVRFNYVFGSEEYLEFVNAGYNDVFAFLLSGPGITGTVNIAQIPNTMIPVTIDNVNTGSYSQYYVDNEWTAVGQTQYDGYTVPLEAIYTDLIPCEIYHIKIAIADAGDGILDSGVFLEAKSFNTGSVTNVSAYGSVAGTSDVYEGCETGYFEFRRGDLTTMDEDYIIPITVSGTAVMGPGDDADFAPLPDEIIIPAGDTTVLVGVYAYADGIAEAPENIVISLDNEQCDCTNIPVLAILILYDNVVVDAGEDQIICLGESVQLGATPTDNVIYEWSNENFLNDATIPNPIATPDTTMTFGVRSTDSNGCEAEDWVTVFVVPPPVVENIAIDTTICVAETVELQLGNLSNIAGYQYQWSPITNLDDSYSPSPIATVSSSTSYTLTVVNSAGCSSVQTININVQANPITVELEDVAICDTDSATLVAPDGFASYLWSNNDTTQSISTTEAGIYELTVTDDLGCLATTSAEVSYAENPTPNISGPSTFNTGTVATLSAENADFIAYEWSTGDTTATIRVGVEGEYAVTVTNEAGCKADAVFEITERLTEPFLFPTAFSPNGDGINDEFGLIEFGAVTDLRLAVYNRWGNLVFETNDISEKWNGELNDRNMQIGVYVYYAEVKLQSGKSKFVKGNITLIK